MRRAALIALPLLLAPSALAQEADQLTIERLYGSPSLNGPAPRALRFSPDGERITFLRAKEEDANVLDLWAIDVAGGEAYLLVDSDVLVPEDVELSEAERQRRERQRISASGIVEYDWDSNGDAILVPLGGDIFYVDVETQEARRLTETETFETDARISPNGNFVSFIRDQNLYVIDLATGEERALTSEGGGVISWGMAEFVAQEEMDRDTGYWWSPDEAYIAAARVDETLVEIIPRLEIGAEGATVVEQRYPRAGDANALVSLHMIALDDGETVEVDLGEDTDIYLARVNWRRDSSEALVQRQNRQQTVLDLLAADPATGETRTLLTETDDAWINLNNDLRPLADGSILWTSERSGFRHIYRYVFDGDDTTMIQITSGDWVVDQISGVDLDAGTVWFEGWTEDPTQRHLYSVPLDGGEPTQITSGDGWWSATVNSGGTAFIGSYSDPVTPTQTALYDMSGERIRWLEENALVEGHPYFPYADDHITPEFGTIAAEDGTPLHWMMYLPADFDPEETYPAIVYVYGGPHAQQVRRNWAGGTPQIFAQAGYVYFILDNRGSWNRGHAFETPLHRAMGQVEVRDQLAGLDYLQSLDFVDADRVGIWGWSYGGYMTLMTTLQAPGRFAAGVAGAPVTDWSLYDTHYTERYMGTPEDNPEGYEQGSAFAHIDNYETPLLIIHGMADDNVIFANTTRLIDALQSRSLQFELMTYPGQRHGIRTPERQTHRTQLILDYFDRMLAE
ncbi:MAG: prolyl oligopeptidase family serine peptidase [Alphaproteobacteria bacterium]|nr:prolyl oligopeptidase family serine peptidase [Alphaproteobacteria bacterium]